jgi:hypothetical protein
MASTISRSRYERNAAANPPRPKPLSWTPFLAAFGLLLAACGDETECNMDSASRMLGGPGVIDCGKASADDDPAIVDRCTVETYNARGTFRAIYEQEDGELSAIVHAAGDTYHLLRMLPDVARIDQADCEGAHVVQSDGRTYVQCDEPTRFRTLCP